MNSIKDLITTPNPIYSRYLRFWNFLLDSYEGGIDYTQSQVRNTSTEGVEIRVNGKVVSGRNESNLWQHPKEKEKSYNDRLKMSYYYNFCSPIIEIYTNHLFKDNIEVDFDGIDETTLDAVSENIDKMGSNIDEFRGYLAETAQVFGHAFVLCDKPKSEQSIITLKDKIDAGFYPYFVLYKPQSVINWALDEFGRPYWVILQDCKDANVDPFNINTSSSISKTYKLWTRDEWISYNSEYKEIERGLHEAGQVPIECIFDKKSMKVRNFLGISTLADISLIARDVYNSCSELKQILRDQTFAFLALQGDATEYNELSVGTSKGLLYPEGRNAPQYVSPPPANAEVYFQHIDRQISKMFQLAKLEGGSASFQGQTAVEQSGVSKAWDFNQTNSTLAKKASSLEDGETKLWQLFAKMDGGEFKGYVSYPKEFSIKSLNGDLDEAEKMAKISLGDMFMKEVKKAIITKKFPRKPTEEIDKMIDDIKTESNGDIKSRLPFLFNRNANSSGKKEGE